VLHEARDANAPSNENRPANDANGAGEAVEFDDDEAHSLLFP
jgi:hypothetical protein